MVMCRICEAVVTAAQWRAWKKELNSLLTHGQFREQPQRQRRSHPRGSKCSSSVGGTSLSLERNLGNRKDHTAPTIKLNITERGVLYNVIATRLKVSVFSFLHL